MPFLLSDKRRYGYYQIGSQWSYSKLEAYEISAVSNAPVTWHYNTDTYSQHPWNIEPPGSLEFWYQQRAQQIRDQYDYIVLWYSGGADSDNILETFVRNNIFIDEIAQYHNLEAEHGNKQSWANQEVFETSVPATQKLLENNPTYKTTQHRLVDISTFQKDLLITNENQWDFFYKVNQYTATNTLGRARIRESTPDYQKLTEQGKRVCFIWGVEKPKITIENNQYYVNFQDGQDHGVTAGAQQLGRDWEYDEFFYWAPDMPQLPCKQAHVIRKYIEQVTPADVDGIHLCTGTRFVDEWGTQVIDRNLTSTAAEFVKQAVTYRLTLRGLHRIIYPYWKPDAIVCGKPGSYLFNPRDAWLWKGNAPDIGQRFFTGGLLSMRQKIKSIDPSAWWEFKYDPKKAAYNGGIKPLFNKYYIGPRNAT
jgi:hypothetical protein